MPAARPGRGDLAPAGRTRPVLHRASCRAPAPPVAGSLPAGSRDHRCRRRAQAGGRTRSVRRGCVPAPEARPPGSCRARIVGTTVPTALPCRDVTRHLRGDDEAGHVHDRVHASTSTIHRPEFGVPTGGGFGHPDPCRTVFGAGEVRTVRQRRRVLANPATGEVRIVETGQPVLFRRDAWHPSCALPGKDLRGRWHRSRRRRGPAPAGIAPRRTPVFGNRQGERLFPGVAPSFAPRDRERHRAAPPRSPGDPRDRPRRRRGRGRDRRSRGRRGAGARADPDPGRSPPGGADVLACTAALARGLPGRRRDVHPPGRCKRLTSLAGRSDCGRASGSCRKARLSRVRPVDARPPRARDARPTGNPG